MRTIREILNDQELYVVQLCPDCGGELSMPIGNEVRAMCWEEYELELLRIRNKQQQGVDIDSVTW